MTVIRFSRCYAYSLKEILWIICHVCHVLIYFLFESPPYFSSLGPFLASPPFRLCLFDFFFPQLEKPFFNFWTPGVVALHRQESLQERATSSYTTASDFIDKKKNTKHLFFFFFLDTQGSVRFFSLFLFYFFVQVHSPLFL